jgi:uncharacterized membrane protein YkoI
MNTSMKLLVSMMIASLGVAGLAQLVHANQVEDQAAVIQNLKSQLQANNPLELSEKVNRDGEMNGGREQRESQRLQSLAKITPQQAQQAAEAAEKGTASRVKLENEDGNLVYAVTIGQKEVKVDAGDSRILYTDTVGSERRDQNRPKSSIQISQSTDDIDDGDGETNDDG